MTYRILTETSRSKAGRSVSQDLHRQTHHLNRREKRAVVLVRARANGVRNPPKLKSSTTPPCRTVMIEGKALYRLRSIRNCSTNTINSPKRRNRSLIA